MKLKTKRSAAKRFKLTGTGKSRMSHAFRSHILTKKSAKRKRRLRKKANLSPADMKRVKRMLVLS